MVFFLLIFVPEFLHDYLSVFELPFVLLELLSHLSILFFKKFVRIKQFFGLAFEIIQLIVKGPYFVFFVLLKDHGVKL